MTVFIYIIAGLFIISLIFIGVVLKRFLRAIDAFEHLIVKFIEINQKFYDVQQKQIKQLDDITRALNQIVRLFGITERKNTQIGNQLNTTLQQLKDTIQLGKTTITEYERLNNESKKMRAEDILRKALEQKRKG